LSTWKGLSSIFITGTAADLFYRQLNQGLTALGGQFHPIGHGCAADIDAQAG
jgi:hypothetical protein